MSEKQIIDASAFLLRNYQYTTLEEANDLFDELWYLLVEGKYKPKKPSKEQQK